MYFLVEKKFTLTQRLHIITSTDGDDMGIHYDYKSTRQEKKLRKQQEREQRRLSKKRDQVSKEPKTTVPEDVIITMDMITDPNRNK